MKLRLPYKSGTVRVSSPYGMRTLSGVTEMHKGVDLVGTDKTIVAPCDGRIGWAGEYNDKSAGGNTWQWGRYIRLETDDGYYVYMCHMSSIAVKQGQRVNTGDVLGVEGSTGKSTGSHCHLEVRYGGKSTDPTPMLDIANRTGSYPVGNTDVTEYTAGGLRFVRMKHPRLVYLDAGKHKIPGKNACNADFFGNYKRGKTSYTLPRGNLVCDMGSYAIPENVKQDLVLFVQNGKLRYSAKNNAADSAFRTKDVSTLVITKSGSAFVTDTNDIHQEADVAYAVSGVPCVRHGDDVDWHNYVAKQGWPADTVRNTYHNWIGVRGNEIWLITGKSAAKSGNMIYGMWFWNIVKGEGFDDIIKLDGGGSYYCKIGGKTLPGSIGTRQINAYLTWE